MRTTLILVGALALFTLLSGGSHTAPTAFQQAPSSLAELPITQLFSQRYTNVGPIGSSNEITVTTPNSLGLAITSISQDSSTLINVLVQIDGQTVWSGHNSDGVLLPYPAIIVRPGSVLTIGATPSTVSIVGYILTLGDLGM